MQQPQRLQVVLQRVANQQCLRADVAQQQLLRGSGQRAAGGGRGAAVRLLRATRARRALPRAARCLRHCIARGAAAPRQRKDFPQRSAAPAAAHLHVLQPRGAPLEHLGGDAGEARVVVGDGVARQHQRVHQHAALLVHQRAARELKALRQQGHHGVAASARGLRAGGRNMLRAGLASCCPAWQPSAGMRNTGGAGGGRQSPGRQAGKAGRKGRHAHLLGDAHLAVQRHQARAVLALGRRACAQAAAGSAGVVVVGARLLLPASCHSLRCAAPPRSSQRVRAPAGAAWPPAAALLTGTGTGSSSSSSGGGRPPAKGCVATQPSGHAICPSLPTAGSG
jgi:hypothetical protein